MFRILKLPPYKILFSKLTEANKQVKMGKNKVSEASFLVLAKVPSYPHGPSSV